MSLPNGPIKVGDLFKLTIYKEIAAWSLKEYTSANATEPYWRIIGNVYAVSLTNLATLNSHKAFYFYLDDEMLFIHKADLRRIKSIERIRAC